MKLNLQLLQQILDIAEAKGSKGFKAANVLTLCHNNQDELELIFHLDYLTDKGFIVGEFMPIGFTSLGFSPQSVRFVRGTITDRGQEYRMGLTKNKSRLKSIA